ncbi:MAG: hypothetical protein ACPW60_10260 [Methylohalobius sp. ZOD2]
MIESEARDFEAHEIKQLIFSRVIAESDFNMGSQVIAKGDRGLVIYGIAPLPEGVEDPLAEFGPRIPKVLVIWDNPGVSGTSFRKPEFERYLKVMMN